MAEVARTAADTKVARPVHWVVLLASAVLEAVWALALDASQGFSVPLWSGVFLVASVLSMLGLGYAMTGITIGVAYAVWTGTGAALTVTVAMLSGAEPVSALKILFLGGIVACVVGLKFTDSTPVPERPSRTEPGASAG